MVSVDWNDDARKRRTWGYLAMSMSLGRTSDSRRPMAVDRLQQAWHEVKFWSKVVSVEPPLSGGNAGHPSAC